MCTKVLGTLREGLSMFIFTAVWNIFFYSLTTVQREPIFVFAWEHLPVFRCVCKIAESYSFVRFLCLHGTPGLPLDWFSWNLIPSICWKFVKKIQVSLKSDKNIEYVMTSIHFLSYLAQFLEWEMFRQRCRENQNTHFMFSNFWKSCLCEVMWNKVDPEKPLMTIWHVYISW